MSEIQTHNNKKEKKNFCGDRHDSYCMVKEKFSMYDADVNCVLHVIIYMFLLQKKNSGIQYK